jgi:hypothetical protein
MVAGKGNINLAKIHFDARHGYWRSLGDRQTRQISMVILDEGEMFVLLQWLFFLRIDFTPESVGTCACQRGYRLEPLQSSG